MAQDKQELQLSLSIGQVAALFAIVAAMLAGLLFLIRVAAPWSEDKPAVLSAIESNQLWIRHHAKDGHQEHSPYQPDPRGGRPRDDQ